MRLIIFGAPGAGKGSQAPMLTQKFGIPHISTGDIFRYNIKNGTELGLRVKEYLDKGELVPDELTVGIVKDRLGMDDCANGFLLDGYPRNIPQAEALEEFLAEKGSAVDKVINLEVDEEIIIKRLSGRRVCLACGAIYNVFNSAPSEEGKCDKCGAAVIQRDDDKEETVRERLRIFHEQTEPLIDFYRRKGVLVTVRGGTTVEETSGEILKALGVVDDNH